VDLTNKVAVVTGGAQGIGLATCKRLVAAGCKVSVWDINPDALKEAVTELDGAGSGTVGKQDSAVRILDCRVDITDRNQVSNAVSRTESELGPIDILINNAGIFLPGELMDRPVDDWVRTIDVNVNSMFYTIMAVLPGMTVRKSGHIVNISSAGGLLGVPGLAAYSASKYAVLGLTESLRHEARNARSGVRYSSIHPMFITTGLFEGAKLGGFGRLIVPQVRNHDVIAKAIVEKALKKGRLMVGRPRTLRLTGLFRGILPYRVFLLVPRLFGVQNSMGRLTSKGSKDGR